MTTHAPTAEERAAFVAPRPKRHWWQTRKGTAAGTAGGKVVYFARSATIIDPSTQAHYLDRSDLAFRADSTVAVFDPQAARRHHVACVLSGISPLDEGSVWMPTGSRTTLISPDEVLNPSLTLLQNLVIPCATMGQTLDPEVIESTASRLGIDLTRSASDLSASKLLDFQVLRAIVYRANLVIISDLPADVDQGDFLDEFFDALAPLRSSGACVVFFTDLAQAAERADRLLIIANSTVAADTEKVDAQFISMAYEAINEDPSSYLGPIPRAGDPILPPSSPSDEANSPAGVGTAVGTPGLPHENDEASEEEARPAKESSHEESSSASEIEEEEPAITPNWHPLTTRVVRTADSPLPEPVTSQWDDNPETAEIALAAIAEAQRFHRIDQARASLGDELKEQLNEDLPAASEASPEELALIEHAQKILGELPGSVIPDEDSAPESDAK
ncbi:hypothetical protein [Actinomyces sp. oral taxon 181]|uniref:hypothetical protein n=1 Tax=Actinomyces sp. oral taxon 181 TaxID=712121 RepID=UPI0025BB9FAA|nr:hypothetical protein [Actinomyces sp. oral taxon 181]MBS5750408.1 hypothetical protein [Actinomyces sp. oral taxon 181]